MPGAVRSQIAQFVDSARQTAPRPPHQYGIITLTACTPPIFPLTDRTTERVNDSPAAGFCVSSFPNPLKSSPCPNPYPFRKVSPRSSMMKTTTALTPISGSCPAQATRSGSCPATTASSGWSTCTVSSCRPLRANWWTISTAIRSTTGKPAHRDSAAERPKQASQRTLLYGPQGCGNRRKYHARIQLQGIRYHLGFFDDAETAALAYDCAARTLFGTFAVCNYPDKKTPRSVAVSVTQRLKKRGLQVE
jgi:hypothetical protein